MCQNVCIKGVSHKIWPASQFCPGLALRVWRLWGWVRVKLKPRYHMSKYLRVINQANELLNKIFCLSSLKNTELIFIICGFWVFKFASSLKFICNPQISISALSWSFTYIELWTFKVAQSAYFQLRLNKATLCLLLKKTEI